MDRPGVDQLTKSQRAAENRDGWRKLVVKSSALSKRHPRLRDGWKKEGARITTQLLKTNYFSLPWVPNCMHGCNPWYFGVCLSWRTGHLDLHLRQRKIWKKGDGEKPRYDFDLKPLNLVSGVLHTCPTPPVLYFVSVLSWPWLVLTVILTLLFNNVQWKKGVAYILSRIRGVSLSVPMLLSALSIVLAANRHLRKQNNHRVTGMCLSVLMLLNALSVVFDENRH